MDLFISANLCNDCTQDGRDTVLTLSQKKFCADGDTSMSEGYMWQVPVNVKVQGKEGEEKFLLENKKMEYRLKGVEPGSWIKVCMCVHHTQPTCCGGGVFVSVLDLPCA